MILAIDPGNKYTGLAISDSGYMIAQPYKTIESRKTKTLLYGLKKSVEHLSIHKVIIGVPDFIQHSSLWMKIEKIEEFFQKNDIETIRWDESFTTKLSVESKDDHQKAACIILQEYLDNKRQ